LRQCEREVGILEIANTRFPTGEESVPPDAVPKLTERLEQWFVQCTLPPPEQKPLPHIILVNLLFHAACIFLHRPFYRAPSPPTELSSARRCDIAADNIMKLLKLYDRVHGVRLGPMTLSTSRRGTRAYTSLHPVRSVDNLYLEGHSGGERPGRAEEGGRMRE
jgi:hypothetical protein